MIRLWSVDAFTTTPFCGNPAAVCIIRKYDEKLCQSIAAEMNLSETAFLVPIYDDDDNNNISSITNKYYLRWWTPATEVAFCGHATLASAHLLYSKGFVDVNKPIQFQTKQSGIFIASKPNPSKQEYLMNFPALSIAPYNGNKAMVSNILNIKPIKNIVEAGEDLLIELDDVHLVKKCAPNFGDIKDKLGKYRCILVTAKVNKEYNSNANNTFDFESRVYCPKCGIDEDPVTGSAHSALAVYWSNKLNKTNEWLNAYQSSKRGGYIKVKYDKQKGRVLIIGNAITVTEMSMMIPSKL